MRMLCVGDVAFGNDNSARGSWKPPAGLLSGDDVRFLMNWELPVGEAVNPVRRASGPRLVAPSDTLRLVESWSPGFATLATNHILDAGAAGLAMTMDGLRRIGFTTVGAGHNQDEITRPLTWETAEGRLAIVNWVFPETHPEWMCVPGPNCWPGLEAAEALIRDLKQDATWVLVVVHWSDELFPYPRPEDRQTARELARMGADLIVGHHPHVVRGMELIGACPVFYSVGNFYFEDMFDRRWKREVRSAPRNREGLGVEISFRRGKRPEYRLLSFWDSRGEVVLDRWRRAARRTTAVSRPLRRLQDAQYAEWHRAGRVRFLKWDSKWHFGVRRLGIRGTMRRLLQKVA